MKHLQFGLVALCALAASGPAWGHHSRAMFEDVKTVVLNGTVKQVDWSNPHVWIQVTAPSANGGTEDWAIEASSTLTMTGVGWKRDSFKPGDKVAVTVNPRKDGGHAGGFVSAVFADGRILKGVNRTARAAGGTAE